MRAAVLTVSDGVVAGTRDDTSGDLLEARLRGAGFELAARRAVADEQADIVAALRDLAARADLVVSTGGMSQIVAAAARRAGLGVIHAHRLRHSVATQLLSAGAGLPDILQG